MAVKQNLEVIEAHDKNTLWFTIAVLSEADVPDSMISKLTFWESVRVYNAYGSNP